MNTLASHVIGRVSAVLRALSTAQDDGASTTWLAQETGLARPTVHRLLVALADEGQVDRDQRTGRDISAYLERVDLTARWGQTHSPDSVWERITQTREAGYAVNPGLIVESSWGMAAAVFGRSGTADWALTLTGVESRFRPARRAELGALLLHEAHQLTQRIRAQA